MDSIKEFIHYYYGQECFRAIIVPGQEPIFEKSKINSRTLFELEQGLALIKLECRKLTSITLQEAMHVMRLVVHPIRDYPEKDYILELNNFGNPAITLSNDWFQETMTFGLRTGAVWMIDADNTNHKIPASVYHYLLKQGFWLFGNEAFEKGLIIEREI